MLAGPPQNSVAVPNVVREIAAGREVAAVWLNQLGGITFQIGAGSVCSFVKWAPTGSGLDLADEAARMKWAAPFSRVPEVLDTGEDESGSWLLTASLDGETAVAPRWKRQPHAAVRAIGVGLRYLHEHAPVTQCPFSWSVPERVERAQQRARHGVTDPAQWHPEHHGMSVSHALARLADPPPVDRLVVCHGDACAPNTLIHDGMWAGHVDLGSLGVADRWADLAIATWSTEWNFGPGWERELVEAYGTDPDPARTAYYRLLWDLT